MNIVSHMRSQEGQLTNSYTSPLENNDHLFYKNAFDKGWQKARAKSQETDYKPLRFIFPEDIK